MDKLANQLKLDAEQIDVRISDELEQRIEASLQGIAPQRRMRPDAMTRPAGFWWASSLTGVAVTLLIVAFFNFQSGHQQQPDVLTTTSPMVAMPSVPRIDWRTESAMLTSPLRQELDNLQSDIQKAEQRVRREIGL